MATKDNNSGLLAKMAKFVRNPTTDWAQLDSIGQEPEQDSGYSKKSLKEMIERKRQNDFVRRREFDQLRKLRRNGPVINADLAGRPSFFQSSTASNPDERAMTIKKIDEIEAQMSKQWWKGMPDVGPTVPGNYQATDVAPLAASSGSAPLAPGGDHSVPFPTTLTAELSSDFDHFRSGATKVTPAPLPAPDRVGSAPAAQPRDAPGVSNSKNFDSGISGFSGSKLFSIELGDNLADPDMEEAAIRFANGDDAGAEAGLLTALQADNVNPDSANGWAAALFDLYRATGQQASFDRVAIEYAQRFGHSAPAWFSTPDLLGHTAAGLPLSQPALFKQTNQTVWECPAELNIRAVQDLRSTLSYGVSPWHLNWSRLKTISPDAGMALATMFAEWCDETVSLHFVAAGVLEKTLASYTLSGNRQGEPFWWRLRLDALRILRLQDEFELAALDFCVIYEVSPPPWLDAQCDYVEDSDGSQGEVASTFRLASDADSDAYANLHQALTVPMGIDAISAGVVELTGEVLGDAAQTLDKLQDGLTGTNRLVISCARLIRVDFSAAGSILNWVAARESEGCQVKFRDVPRLVAAFFNVIGINEHAQVVVRNS